LPYGEPILQGRAKDRNQPATKLIPQPAGWRELQRLADMRVAAAARGGRVDPIPKLKGRSIRRAWGEPTSRERGRLRYGEPILQGRAKDKNQPAPKLIPQPVGWREPQRPAAMRVAAAVRAEEWIRSRG